MHNALLRLAAVLGAVAVALGAFGAHALKKMATEAAISIFETAVKYQFYHVFAIALAAILYREYPNKWIVWSGYSFVTGILLFSGSLYLLTYIKAAGKIGLDWVGIITPFGGLAFIAGWLFMLIGIMKA